MKVLLVESSSFVNPLQKNLSYFGFSIDIVDQKDEVISYDAINNYDILVTDVNILKNCNFGILHKIRHRNQNIKILILSTDAQLEDRVRCLEAGVDDYIVVPFTFNEFIARLKTLAKRKILDEKKEISLGNVTICTSTKKVECMGCDVQLTPSEYKVMEYIILSRGRVISKNQLEEILYDEESYVCSNVVEVIVSNLRKKIKQLGVDPPIKTRRGFGYYVEAKF